MTRTEQLKANAGSNPSNTGGGGVAAWQSLIALVLGLAIGIAVSNSGSAFAARLVGWLEPLGTLWVNGIRMTVIPLIVASLLVAVSGAEARTVGRLGSRAFVIFAVLLAMQAVFAAVVTPLIFEHLTIDPTAAQSIRAGVPAVTRPELPGFASWLVSLVPVNPVKAAADGAMLPLMVFTLALGLALGRLTSIAREPVVTFFRGVADAMVVLVRWILMLAPLGIFVLALSLATKVGSGIMGAVGFYVVAHVSLLLVGIALLYVIVVVVARVPLMKFARALLPGQMVAMTTRASLAALPALMTSAEQTLELPSTVTSFALPLAVSTFRFNTPVTYVVMTVFAGKLYGVELASSQIATIAFTSVLVSFGAPGIPSGALFIIAPFLATVGIPPEAIGVLLAVDVLPDVFKTLANTTGHLAAVTLLSRGERGQLGRERVTSNVERVA
jgi:proton glutamate symport protein